MFERILSLFGANIQIYWMLTTKKYHFSITFQSLFVTFCNSTGLHGGWINQKKHVFSDSEKVWKRRKDPKKKILFRKNFNNTNVNMKVLIALLWCKTVIFTHKQDLWIKIPASHHRFLQRHYILTWENTPVLRTWKQQLVFAA